MKQLNTSRLKIFIISIATFFVQVSFSQSTIIGTTTYDVQTNDGSKNHIIPYDDGTISAVWTGSAELTSAFSDRGTYYNRYDGSTWGAYPTARVESVRVGFGELTRVDDHEVTVSHYFDGIGYSIKIFANDAIGSSTWTETSGSGVVTGLWPFSDSPAGTDDLYIVNANANPPTAFNFSRSDDGGETWSVLNYELPYLSAADGIPYVGGAAESYQIKVYGADVYVLFGMPTSDLVLLHSNDYGNPGSWERINIIDFPYDNFDGTVQTDVNGDFITDTLNTNDGYHEMIITDDGTVHIYSGYIRIYSDGFGYIMNYRASGIWHWSTGMAAAELINTEIDWSSPDGYYNPYGGIGAYVYNYRNAAVSSSPAASWDAATGRLYLLYTMKIEYTDIYGDPSNPSAESFRDIFGIYSDDGGSTWSTPKNLTNTAESGQENFYVSASDRVVDGKVHATWQQDDQPGHFNEGDPIHSNNILYQGFTAEDFLTAGTLCDATTGPSGEYADGVTSSSATLNWNVVPSAEQYVVSLWNLSTGEIKKKHVFTNSLYISSHLTPSTTYGFRVKTVCYAEGTISPYSDWYYFTTGPGKLGEFDEMVKVYPNPSDGNFNLQLNGYENTQVQLIISNSTGQIVFNNNVNVSENAFIENISLPDMAQGMYQLKVINGNNVVTNNIIIQ